MDLVVVLVGSKFMVCGVLCNFVCLLFGLILLMFGMFVNVVCVINVENGIFDIDSDSVLFIVFKEGV